MIFQPGATRNFWKVVIFGIGCLCASQQLVFAENEDVRVLMGQGGVSTREQVHLSEEKLKKEPDNYPLRVKLIGYYFAKSTKPDSASAKTKLSEHLLWLIKHKPDSPVLGTLVVVSLATDAEVYSTAKSLWLQQVQKHGDRPEVLGHAARLLEIYDVTIAEKLYEKLKKLEPRCPRWSVSLAYIYAIKSIDCDGERKTFWLRKRLNELSRAQSLTKDHWDKYRFFREMAETALDINEPDKASKFVSEMKNMANKIRKKGENISKVKEKAIVYSSMGFESEDAIHGINTLLGRIALKSGEVDKARSYLLDAVIYLRVQKNTLEIKPNMKLAMDLLKAGEKKTVLKYLTLCKQIWKMRKSDFDYWIKAIEKDQDIDLLSPPLNHPKFRLDLPLPKTPSGTGKREIRGGEQQESRKR